MIESGRLPLFPLSLVMYPEEKVPLHIFEPRYKALIGYCLQEDQPFGVVLFTEGKLAEVGCTARVHQVLNRYDDGRLDIVAQGRSRFRVEGLYHEQPFLTAEVAFLSEPRETLDADLKNRAITQHMRLLELAGRELRPSAYEGKAYVSYVLAHNAGLSPLQKQALLEIDGENERITYLVRHFEGLIPEVERMGALREKIQSNGHIRDFPPVP